MEKYQNLGGDSGVIFYEINDESIKVWFNDGKWYFYTYTSAGSSNIEEMKRLAQQGQGLNAYINQYVRDKYESKG